jgi:hypothetical protein
MPDVLVTLDPTSEGTVRIAGGPICPSERRAPAQGAGGALDRDASEVDGASVGLGRSFL